jgi:hypothetical protein
MIGAATANEHATPSARTVGVRSTGLGAEVPARIITTAELGRFGVRYRPRRRPLLRARLEAGGR